MFDLTPAAAARMREAAEAHAGSDLALRVAARRAGDGSIDACSA